MIKIFIFYPINIFLYILDGISHGFNIFLHGLKHILPVLLFLICCIISAYIGYKFSTLLTPDNSWWILYKDFDSEQEREIVLNNIFYLIFFICFAVNAIFWIWRMIEDDYCFTYTKVLIILFIVISCILCLLSGYKLVNCFISFCNYEMEITAITDPIINIILCIFSPLFLAIVAIPRLLVSALIYCLLPSLLLFICAKLSELIIDAYWGDFTFETRKIDT